MFTFGCGFVGLCEGLPSGHHLTQALVHLVWNHYYSTLKLYYLTELKVWNEFSLAVRNTHVEASTLVYKHILTKGKKGLMEDCVVVVDSFSKAMAKTEVENVIFFF